MTPQLIDALMADKLLPRRAADAHKGTCGRVYAFAGSRRYPGAARLCIRAMLRGGAGLVSAHVPEAIWALVAADTCEAMTAPLPEDGEGRFSLAGRDGLLQALRQADAAAIGPGLDRDGDLPALVGLALKTAGCPIVLDADGINAFATHIHPLTDCPCVLTPHEGEFARLGGDTANPDRAAATAELAERLHCVIVRKGPGTLVASARGDVRQNTTGNPGMASGGMGDVLTGLIAALLGQGLTPFDAASLAVWLHGRAGDLCAEHFSPWSMLPSDVVNALGDAFLQASHADKTGRDS